MREKYGTETPEGLRYNQKQEADCKKKKTYGAYKEARVAAIYAKFLHRESFYVYRCKVCRQYHLTTNKKSNKKRRK